MTILTVGELALDSDLDAFVVVNPVEIVYSNAGECWST